MNRMQHTVWLAMTMLLASTASFADEPAVNGYTYIAPSYYPAPPIVVYDPAFVVPVATVFQPLHYGPPVSVVTMEPAFLTQTVSPFNPTWNYPPAVVPAPVSVRERVRVGRAGADYRYRAYLPGRAAPVYSYEVDSHRHGVTIRERVR